MNYYLLELGATVAIAILPIGPLLNQNEKNLFNKLTLRGWFFYLAVIVLLFSGYKKQTIERDKEILQNKQDSLLTNNVDNIRESINQQLLNLNETSLELVDLNNSTKSLVHERKDLTGKLEKWNSLLRKSIESDSFNFLLSKPFLNINANSLQWIEIPDSSDYGKLKVHFENSGKRRAKYLDHRIYLFVMEGWKVIESINAATNKLPSTYYESLEKSNTYYWITSDRFRLNNKSKENESLLAYVKILYEDELLQKKDTLVRVFIWRNFKLDSDRFSGAAKILEDSVFVHMKTNNLKF